MNELFLFIPGRHIESLESIEQFGYGGFVDRDIDGTDDRLQIFNDVAGPKDTTGALIVVVAPDGIARSQAPAYDLSTQHWTSTASEWDELATPAWVGYQRDFPPTPHSLRRRVQFMGPLARLNGEDWMLPILGRLPLVPDWGSTEATASDRIAHRLARELMVWLQTQNTAAMASDSFCPPGSRALVEYALQRNYRGNWQFWESLDLFHDVPKVTALAMLHATGISVLTQGL